MPDAVLALNAGSSSIKFALFEVGEADALRLLSKGQVEGLGTAPHFLARDAAGKTLEEKRWPDAKADHETVLGTLLAWIDAHLGGDSLVAVGHRVVHGGRDFTAPVRLTPAVVEALDRLTPLAPLHQPHSLEPIRTLMAIRPGLPQVACFDTAFHRTMPAVATRFALPRRFGAEGVRRYGFHGLSYEYIARTLRTTVPHLAAGRLVVAHLGNGASLCAMADGVSVDTTMGFTALDGLVMGTRCGTLDAGVVLYMLQEKGLSAAAVQHLLYSESGLLGVSGVSSDMRTLLASPDPHAREAVELFVFRIARETAALAASMGGLDGFIFTAGIGEHAAEVRAMVCERLAWLGVEPGGDGPVAVHVIPTDEEKMIAIHTLECLAVLVPAP
jgi:acetate kinase